MRSVAMFLKWLGTRWRRPAPLPRSATALLPTAIRTVRVPAEYRSLYTYLEQRYASVVVLTLEQIEALMGSPLPATARSERDWWTAGGGQPHPQSAAWT